MVILLRTYNHFTTFILGYNSHSPAILISFNKQQKKIKMKTGTDTEDT